MISLGLKVDAPKPIAGVFGNAASWETLLAEVERLKTDGCAGLKGGGSVVFGLKFEVDPSLPDERMEIRDAEGHVLHEIRVDPKHPGHWTMSIAVPR